jgi:SAM-dependent methyltransferase
MKQAPYVHHAVAAYSITAQLYDSMVGLYAFDQLRDNFERLEKRYALDLSFCGDVACGTGLFTRYLFERGAGVIGFDLSTGMLRAAMKRLGRTGVQLLRQDMRYLSPPMPLTMIICATDALNHLLDEADIRRSLRSFFASLRPGGHAIFDLNTAWQLREQSDSVPWDFEIEGAVMRWESGWEEAEATAELRLIFPDIKDNDGVPYMETHLEKAYSPEYIMDVLEGAGFSRAEMFDAAGLGKPGEKTRRLQFVAVK